MAKAPTREQWLKALDEAGMPEDDGDPSWVTVEEFRVLMSPDGIPISRSSAERRLNRLVEKGKAERMHRIVRIGDRNRRIRVLAFKLAEA